MIVLDSSALIAYLFGEPGAKTVQAHLRGSLLSIVNLTEVLSKSVQRGLDPQPVLTNILNLGISIAALDESQALIAAEMQKITVVKGLSLGDRVCLALATVKNCEVLTGERVWPTLPLGVKVTLIR